MNWESIGDEDEGEGENEGENDEKISDEITEEQNLSEEKEIHNIKDLSDEELGKLVRDALKRNGNKSSLEDDKKAINQKRVNTEQSIAIFIIQMWMMFVSMLLKNVIIKAELLNYVVDSQLFLLNYRECLSDLFKY